MILIACEAVHCTDMESRVGSSDSDANLQSFWETQVRVIGGYRKHLSNYPIYIRTVLHPSPS